MSKYDITNEYFRKQRYCLRKTVQADGFLIVSVLWLIDTQGLKNQRIITTFRTGSGTVKYLKIQQGTVALIQLTHEEG